MVAVDASYCPLCGTELQGTEVEGRHRRYCPTCEEVVWRNPVPTAGVVVRDGGEVLVVERGAGPNEGMWTVPGGFIEHDESVPAAAARELDEETGIVVDPDDLKLLATHHHRAGKIYTVLIRYVVDRDVTTGEPEAGSDATTARFQTLDDIPDDRISPHNQRFVRIALEREEPSV